MSVYKILKEAAPDFRHEEYTDEAPLLKVVM
jgi:hypothetical protein